MIGRGDVVEVGRGFVFVATGHAVAVAAAAAVVAETEHAAVHGETAHRSVFAVTARAAAFAVAGMECGVELEAKARDVAVGTAWIGVAAEATERLALVVLKAVVVGEQWVWKWTVVSEAGLADEQPGVGTVWIVASASARPPQPVGDAADRCA